MKKDNNSKQGLGSVKGKAIPKAEADQTRGGTKKPDRPIAGERDTPPQ